MGARYHDLIDMRFFHIWRGQSVFDTEGIDAKEKLVTIEHLEIGLRERTDHGFAGTSDVPAKKNQVEAFVRKDFLGDIERIGQYGEILELMQIARNLKGSRSRIYDYGVAILDHFSRGTTYGLLFTIVSQTLHSDVGIIIMTSRIMSDCATSGPDQKIPLLQYVEVLSDSHLRHTELLA